MKALTLHQQWASLIAVGAKTIETRSWSTEYRGRLAIHAAKRPPRGWWSRICDPDEYRHAAPEQRAALDAGFHQFENDGPLWSAEESTNGEDWYHRWRGPLGAVVATCDLVNVVPIVEGYHAPPGGGWFVAVQGDGTFLYRLGSGLFTPLAKQLPFGDFSPGRFAWLLGAIEACDPIPVRGKQGLWNFSSGPWVSCDEVACREQGRCLHRKPGLPCGYVPPARAGD